MVSLLIIGFVLPEPNSSTAGGRMMQLILCFKNKVSTSHLQVQHKTLILWLIWVYNVQKNLFIELWILMFIKELNPSVVLFDRLWSKNNLVAYAENCPNACPV
jgi:hypothetical protein